MANPTTYFGWVMPTSSSLVTNLPADFNTFGQGVDTSMQDLLGGTTGQVLSKTSATNMDFTWVTPTDQTPLTTKGDLFAFSTVDARLPAGANETRLVADSAQTLGLKYVADTTNYAIAAKADLLVGTAADTLAALTVGTNGQVLTADSTVSPTGLKWATASSGALTKIVTSTFSGVASTSTTFDGCFTSTYDNYIIIMSALNSSTNNVNFQWQLRNAGSTTTTQYAGSYTQGASVTATSSASSFNVINLTNNTDQQASLNMNFYRNTKCMNWTYQANGRGVSDNSIFGGGFQNTLSALGADGFILSAASGNISGIVTVYGVQK